MFEEHSFKTVLSKIILTLKVMYVNELFISCYISYNREKEKKGKIIIQYLKTPRLHTATILSVIIDVEQLYYCCVITASYLTEV